jgi:hypothetical protein
VCTCTVDVPKPRHRPKQCTVLSAHGAHLTHLESQNQGLTEGRNRTTMSRAGARQHKGQAVHIVLQPGSGQQLLINDRPSAGASSTSQYRQRCCHQAYTVRPAVVHNAGLTHVELPAVNQARKADNALRHLSIEGIGLAQHLPMSHSAEQLHPLRAVYNRSCIAKLHLLQNIQ